MTRYALTKPISGRNLQKICRKRKKQDLTFSDLVDRVRRVGGQTMFKKSRTASPSELVNEGRSAVKEGMEEGLEREMVPSRKRAARTGN